MGLTHNTATAESETKFHTENEYEIVVALAGNPNVGKSTVFNALTGMHQHTGNWSGKTVGIASGTYEHDARTYRVVDLPGTYSLLARSAEETVARDFLTEENPHLTVVVCDATCLERNLNLVLQILECTPRVLLCVNLMDEAKKRRVRLHTDVLHKELHIPVIGISARRKKDIERLKEAIANAVDSSIGPPYRTEYPSEIEDGVQKIIDEAGFSRFQALRLLDGSADPEGASVPDAVSSIVALFHKEHSPVEISDSIVSTLVRDAERISRDATETDRDPGARDRCIDKILTGRWTAYPVMLCLLLLIFWITIIGANYPSSLLSAFFTSLEAPLFRALSAIGTPVPLTELIVYGMYRVLTWVVAVMLPPMAIFFPMFTLLEDVGYLPRIAYNLDRCFHKCGSCGKQALTMCMGFGCNAAGVVGCRIIDSPRERLIAILTNTLVPCNGRFPLLIAMTSLFFYSGTAAGGSLISALFLAAIVVFSVAVTLLVSSLLSKTLLRGIPSAFTLELPPYRRPAIGTVLVRSVLDRTVFVLGRAVAIAAPAGILIWLAANIQVGETTPFLFLTEKLDPIGRIMGMDGVILLAFILGFPANETVIPIIMMGYLATGTLAEYDSLTALHTLLIDNGWTAVTAICVVLFSLMHWPCSTTLWTIGKETRSLKWTAVGFLLPTALGAVSCILVNYIAQLAQNLSTLFA